MGDQAAPDKGEAIAEGEAAQQVEADGAAAAAAAVAGAEAEGAQPAAQPGLAETKERLYAILRTVNFEVRGAEGCGKVWESVWECVWDAELRGRVVLLLVGHHVRQLDLLTAMRVSHILLPRVFLPRLSDA